MQTMLKNHKMQLLINFAVALFFLVPFVIPRGYNYSPFLLALLSLGYLIFYVAVKKQKWILSKEEKWLAGSYIFYFAVFVLSFSIHSADKANTLESPAKILLFLPLLLLLKQFPINRRFLLHIIPCGALIAGLIACYNRFVLHYPMGFGDVIMHIQGGGIAMSFGMFSLAVTVYFAIKKQYKFTALYLFCSLMGIASSFLSTARGSWIGVPFIVLLILFAYRHYLSKKILSAFFVLIAVTVIGLVSLPQSQIIKRFEQAQNDITQYMDGQGSTSLGARFDMWKGTLLATKEKPILGWGETGIFEKKRLQAKEHLITDYATGFRHAHNQFIDDLSKRGIVGLIALLGVLFVPLAFFRKRLKTASLEENTFGLLGCIHIISMMFYCFSQGFFAHNSGSLFYFFLVILFYSMLSAAKQDTAND